MESCKLQIGCMLIVLYILFLSIRERQLYRVTHRDKLFDWLLVVSVLSVLFDGATAWTVNHLDLVPLPVNGVLHACFLSSLDAMIFFMFLYMLDITRGLPQTRPRKLALAPTFAVLGAYLNQESPLHTKLKRYNNEMMMGFATLVENRDDSTGGHIRRTTAYVRLLAEELKARGFYREELTRDYIENLIQAAPMHDIGKIAIPDVFDAVSAKRCYRDALPPDTCFRIIQEGSGQDFDPIMAEVFLEIREKIENEILLSDQKGKVSV